MKEAQHLILLVLKDIADTLHSHSHHQVLSYADFQLRIPMMFERPFSLFVFMDYISVCRMQCSEAQMLIFLLITYGLSRM
jgi:hypothetical protein